MSDVDWQVTLNKGQLLRIDGARGMLLRVEAGSAWLTQSRDAADYCLRAGDAVMLNGEGAALISAFDRCCLALVASGEPAPLFPVLQRFVPTRA
jgi:hypothetical protein